MNFGLIGCGGIGLIRAMALAQSPNHKLIAVSDLDAGRAVTAASFQKAALERNWHDLVNRTDLDAIIISTPPSMHLEMCTEAILAGKHVLCEKPLARTAAEAQLILDAAGKKQEFLATGFNFRFYPPVIQAITWLDSGMIGELDHIRSYAGYSAASHSPEWVHDVNFVGGGTLRDNGIHLIDLTSFFLGGVNDVKGLSSSNVWGYPGCEDNGFLILRGPKGRIASLQASWSEWRQYQFRIEIYGTRGCIIVTCFPMKASITWTESKSGPFKTKTERFVKEFMMEHIKSYRWLVAQSLTKELEAFMEASQGKSSPIATGIDGLRAIEIAQAAENIRE